jgi:serine/threonine protein kinase
MSVLPFTLGTLIGDHILESLLPNPTEMLFIYLTKSITSSHIAVIKWIRSMNPFAFITNEVQVNELLVGCPYLVNADVVAINGSFCPIMNLYRTDHLKYAMSDHLPEEKCAGISFRVLLAIRAMHELGFVHRDIKLENIFWMIWIARVWQIPGSQDSKMENMESLLLKSLERRDVRHQGF